MMVRGECRTNVDEGKGKRWPTVFAKVPEKGELVESLRGETILKVCQVTHCQRVIQNGIYEQTMEPYIKVELTRNG